MKTKKNQYNILKNHTLDEYKAKYDISKAIVLTKDAVDNFNKKHKHAKTRNNIFHGRNWWLIDGDYYEIGEYLEIKPSLHKSHGAGFKIALASILGGVGAAGALGGGGYVIYKAVQAYNPTPGPEPTINPISIDANGRIKVNDTSKIVGEYKIPETINGITVKSIEPYGFRNCTKLEIVELPKTIESIGEGAFIDCTSLTKINISNDSQLKKIDEYAFSYCESLTTINIPDSLETLDEGVFYHCTNLKYFNATGNSKLTTIGRSTFAECTSLTDFLFSDSLKKIDEFAFSKSNISEIKIAASSNLETIGKNAFNECKNLKQVTFENESIDFGNAVFYDCESLIKCKLPSKLKKISSSCFSGCKSLTTIEIPNTITEINSSAFNECYSLGNVTLPEGLTDVGNCAFRCCRSMTEITIPATVTNFGYRIFEYCYNLRTVYVKSAAALVDVYPSSEDYESSCLFQYANTVYIGENVPAETSLCNDLKNNYTISESTEVSGYSKKGVAKTEMYFVAYDWGGTHTKRYYRNSGDTLTDVTITPEGNGGTIIGILPGAFANYTALKTVTIPACLETLGGFCFSGCTSLETITFLSTSKLTSIGEKCFENSGLKNITLPDSLEYISDGAFENCSNLTQINIPASVSINDKRLDIFKGCSSLSAVTIDSPSAAKLKTNNTYMFNANTIYLNKTLKDTLEEGDYLYDYYSISTEEGPTGYYTCTKNIHKF